MSKIFCTINWEQLDLMKKGMMDKDGQIVNADDDVIFHYLDDNFTEHHLLCSNRKELLSEIEKRTGNDNYQPWCFSKVIRNY